ncbi:MAG: alpha-galactosidase [Lachnospiraceae bacterium]|nr:alpha-galactosidase [Lachnospiraceae bacterium]
MAIRFDSKTNTFTIHTVKSTYQMKVDDQKVLLHTYFGSPADESDFSYLIVPDDHGFCAQPAGNAEDRNYSLDFYPQEYSVQGSGDFRIKALKAGFGGRVPALDLRYHSHQIREGKYSLPGLPHFFANDGDKVQTLEIVLKDLYEDVYVTLLYGVFEEKNIITRAAVIENAGDMPMEIKRAMSMCLDFMEGRKELICFCGKHAGERQYDRRTLQYGITEIGSNRGTSSHQHNPFAIVCDKNTTEDYGKCCAVSLLYSGSFQIQAEVDQFEGTRLVCGVNDDEFSWILKKGEQFVTPEAVISYTDNGLADLSGGLHRAIYDNLIRSAWKDRKRPILVNNWEATYFDFTGDKLMEIARQGAQIGLDMLVLDDGWFGKRNDDNSGLGDWYVNEEKLGCSLRELVDQINGLGLRFGIWIEPEMISEDSDLYREHPEWAMIIPGRDPVRGRNQLTLDLSRQEVIEYMKTSIDNLLDSANIEYIKWDMNRSVDNVFSAAAPELSQGAVRHKYILGLYEVMEHIHQKYPEILIEGCSGGGGRYDAGMLFYVPQIWCSDNTDAIERLRIHYGTSFGYPMSTVAAHVSVCPNHQNGRVTPFKTRGICAMQGSFGYELDLGKLTDEEKEEAKKQVAVYNEHYRLFQNGNYYRLTSPMDNHDFTAWSYVMPDGSKAVLSVVYTDLHANPKPLHIKWKGLIPNARYILEGREYTGAALMQGGIVLPKPECNYDSYMVVANLKDR